MEIAYSVKTDSGYLYLGNKDGDIFTDLFVPGLDEATKFPTLEIARAMGEFFCTSFNLIEISKKLISRFKPVKGSEFPSKYFIRTCGGYAALRKLSCFESFVTQDIDQALGFDYHYAAAAVANILYTKYEIEGARMETTEEWMESLFLEEVIQTNTITHGRNVPYQEC